MSKEEAIEKMKQIAKNGNSAGDYEKCHGFADDLLCKVLLDLGYEELVYAFREVPKWYA